MKRFVCLIAAAAMAAAISSEAKTLKVLYWNIQNGMWCGQYDNYDSFVGWVSAQEPDICIWCEGQTIYYTGTYDAMKKDERYLVGNWDELASRYGHKYIYVGGHRDNYPQVITSRYPITNVERITGDESQTVSHGAGWATIEVDGNVINIVTVHTWPQKYSFTAASGSKEEREASAKAFEGEFWRKAEVEHVCKNTILTAPDAAGELWLMAGDFNSVSRLDNRTYGFAADDPRLLTHDYILENTPYIDIVWKQNSDTFCPSTAWGKRIDFVYCTPALDEKCTEARIINDEYTHQEKDSNVSSFYSPSDHLPVIAIFEL